MIEFRIPRQDETDRLVCVGEGLDLTILPGESFILLSASEHVAKEDERRELEETIKALRVENADHRQSVRVERSANGTLAIRLADAESALKLLRARQGAGTDNIALEHASNERDSWRRRAHLAEENHRNAHTQLCAATDECNGLIRLARVLGAAHARLSRAIESFVKEDETPTQAVARAVSEAREVPALRKQLAEAHLRILAVRGIEPNEDPGCESPGMYVKK